MSTTEVRCCPRCDSYDTFREEVDIGVGIQYGPLHCRSCGFNEADELPDFGEIDDDIF
jgi:hypothetical protein